MKKQPEDKWYVADPDHNPPVREVTPIAIRGKWLQLGRSHMVRIGIIAFSSKDEATTAAVKQARAMVDHHKCELQRAYDRLHKLQVS